MTLCISEFLATRYDWRPRTKATAEKHLGYWEAWLNGRDIEAMTVADFENWAAGKSWSDTMRYNSLWSIKSWLGWKGITHPLLAHVVKRTMPPPGLYLEQRDAERLLEVCDPSTPKGLQDATIVAFLWETWARAHELVNAERQRLDLERQEIVFQVKAGEWHQVPFGPDLRELLEAWVKVRDTIARASTKSLFVNIRRGTPLTYWGLREILKNLGQRAGVNVSPHAFRRGAARHHANEGGNDRLGMARGRWTSFASYWRYTRGISLEPLKQKRWRHHER